MKLLNILLILSLMAGTAACSTKKKADATQEATESVAESEEDADFVVDADDEELIAEDESSEEADEIEEVAESSAEEVQASADDSQVQITAVQEYTAEKGDTLMLVAFKLFGDYTKWRELQSMNSDVLANGLRTGTVLRYNSTGFTWNPQGLPYLIKSGDSLSGISKEKYGTFKRWKDIYENNQPMIRDPNLIFAGFTIYYVPDRDIASEE
jgi:nucleoid-associated protein YgaU